MALNTRSLETLHQALPIVAAAYGRKFDVTVEVGGTHACTDGCSEFHTRKCSFGNSLSVDSARV
ncbi:hypothetical protein CKO15_13590 [Halorhodospira abdelmalekii]|nr:hypothetical protein [Halorhodospira abdelmalekii]